MLVIAGLVSMCALTRDVMKLIGGDGGATGSFGPFGLDGKRPLRPLRWSVLTTAIYDLLDSMFVLYTWFTNKLSASYLL